MAMQRRPAFVQGAGWWDERDPSPRTGAASLHGRRGSLQTRGGGRGAGASCGQRAERHRATSPPARRPPFRRALLAVLALAAASASPANAQAPRDRLLVQPAWLAAHLNDPDLVLLHVGDTAG